MTVMPISMTVFAANPLLPVGEGDVAMASMADSILSAVRNLTEQNTTGIFALGAKAKDAIFVMAKAKSRYKIPRVSELEELLHWQIIQAKLPKPLREYQFYKPRRWRFDFAWPKDLVAVEVEGGTWINGAHNRGKHFESDCEKYNTATAYGWRVFRFTAKMVKDLTAIAVIKASL